MSYNKDGSEHDLKDNSKGLKFCIARLSNASSSLSDNTPNVKVEVNN